MNQHVIAERRALAEIADRAKRESRVPDTLAPSATLPPAPAKFAIDLAHFSAREFKPREPMLGPWLCS